MITPSQNQATARTKTWPKASLREAPPAIHKQIRKSAIATNVKLGANRLLPKYTDIFANYPAAKESETQLRANIFLYSQIRARAASVGARAMRRRDRKI